MKALTQMVSELDDLQELTLGSRLRRTTELLYNAADQAYSDQQVDFQASWFPVFQLLSRHGQLSIGELAERAAQTHASISQIAKQLQARSYVEKAASDADRRRQILQLTDQGTELFKTMKPIWQDIRTVLQGYLNDHALLDALADFEHQLRRQSFSQDVMQLTQQRQRNSVELIDFHPDHSNDFRRLNEEWLDKYFYIEDADVKVLSDPQRSIIEPGGDIVFARLGEEIIGTCALINKGDGVYELAKMAVTEKIQGLGIGRRLGNEVIRRYRSLDGTMLFLETNKRLAPAIALYESLGFSHQTRPNRSVYQRSNIYMVWNSQA